MTDAERPRRRKGDAPDQDAPRRRSGDTESRSIEDILPEPVKDDLDQAKDDANKKGDGATEKTR